jgi:glycosyltransferase involved in cell wall biosynthesis
LFGSARLDAEYAARLRQSAAGEPRIRFRGLVDEPGQASIWRSIDLLILPSLWWENSPLVVLEALAAGVAVVASRIGGVPEVLPEAAGVLVPAGDVGGLRATLETALVGRGTLCGALEPLPLKTTSEGARELGALYSELRRDRPLALGGGAA